MKGKCEIWKRKETKTHLHVIQCEYCCLFSAYPLITETFSLMRTIHPCIFRERAQCMGYWPSVRSRWLEIGQVLFCMFMDSDFVSVPETRKKKEANIQPSWLNKLGQWRIHYLYDFQGNFSCGIQRAVLSRQDSSILPACFKWVLGFVIDYAWNFQAFSWCGIYMPAERAVMLVKKWVILGNLAFWAVLVFGR